MTGWLERARRGFDELCRVSECRRPGCSVSLVGLPSARVAVDFDERGSPLGPSDKRPDFLVIAAPADDVGWVAPVELKKGSADVSDAAKQLQAGANVAESRVGPRRVANTVFRPVLATGSMRRVEQRELRMKKNRVRFRGEWTGIERIDCGDRLVAVFSR